MHIRQPHLGNHPAHSHPCLSGISYTPHGAAWEAGGYQPQAADKEVGANHGQQVRRHTKADVESGRAMQEKGLWHEGDTSNDTFLKAVSGYRW